MIARLILSALLMGEFFLAPVNAQVCRIVSLKEDGGGDSGSDGGDDDGGDRNRYETDSHRGGRDSSDSAESNSGTQWKPSGYNRLRDYPFCAGCPDAGDWNDRNRRPKGKAPEHDFISWEQTIWCKDCSNIPRDYWYPNDMENYGISWCRTYGYQNIGQKFHKIYSETEKLHDQLEKIVPALEQRINEQLTRDVNYNVKNEADRYRSAQAAMHSLEHGKELLRKELNEEAEIAIKIANIFLDFATSMTPGIPWYRNLYEATLGVDFLSGEKVSAASRAASMNAVLSHGFSRDANRELKVLHSISYNEVALDNIESAYRKSEGEFRLKNANEKRIHAATFVNSIYAREGESKEYRYRDRMYKYADYYLIDAYRQHDQKNYDESTIALKMAEVFLDFATALTPGVSWARDLYEAVMGVDLISGSQLEIGSELLQSWASFLLE